MFSSLIPTLLQLDPRLLRVLAVIMGVLFLISLFKKVFKLGIVLLIAAVLFGVGAPALNRLRENYDMNYNKQTEVLTIKVSGKDFVLPIKDIKAAKEYLIKFEKGVSDTKVNLSYLKESGLGVSETGNEAVTIPNFMLTAVEKFLSTNDLKYIEEAVTK